MRAEFCVVCLDASGKNRVASLLTDTCAKLEVWMCQSLNKRRRQTKNIEKTPEFGGQPPSEVANFVEVGNSEEGCKTTRKEEEDISCGLYLLSLISADRVAFVYCVLVFSLC